MPFGFGHWWILIVVLFLLAVMAAALAAIIVASSVLTYRLLNRSRDPGRPGSPPPA